MPKCGGVSLQRVLKSWYKRKFYLHYYNEKKNKLPKKITLGKTFFGKDNSNCCIHGHFNKYRNFGINQYYPEARQFITFLRDPLEILISNYFFSTRNGYYYRNGKKFQATESIESYFEKRLINEQSWFETHLPDGINKNNYEDFIHSKFIFIGVMDYYQESVNLLADKLNKPRKELPYINKSPREPYNLSKKLIENFKEKFEFDYLLYNFALDQIHQSQIHR